MGERNTTRPRGQRSDRGKGPRLRGGACGPGWTPGPEDQWQEGTLPGKNGNIHPTGALQPFTTTRMDLGKVMQSEMSQKGNTKNPMTLLICGT